MTWQELIESAMRRLLVLAEGSSATTSQVTDGLESLNALFDSWATERLTCYVIGRTIWTVAASTTSYTVGTGATINVARPEPNEIDHVTIIDTATSPDTEYPCYPLSEQAWAAVEQKLETTADRPTEFYYSPTYSSGFGTLYLLPITTAATYQGALYAPTPVSEVTSATATISLPKGYRRALITNLAVELAPEFGREVPTELLRAAEESKASLKRAHFRAADIGVDSAFLSDGSGGYDIMTDG